MNSNKLIRGVQYLNTTRREHRLHMIVNQFVARCMHYRYALWFYSIRTNQPLQLKFMLKTEHNAATNSPDHLYPHGTLLDNNTHYPFIHWCTTNIGQYKTILDLGCAGGQLMYDFSRIRWYSCGLEGSYKHNAGAWNKHPNLFTCDISKPFEIKLLEDNPHKFDVITLWDVIEHLRMDELKQLFYNIKIHCHTNTLIFVTSDDNSCNPSGKAELHQTRFTKEGWQYLFNFY